MPRFLTDLPLGFLCMFRNDPVQLTKHRNSGEVSKPLIGEKPSSSSKEEQLPAFHPEVRALVQASGDPGSRPPFKWQDLEPMPPTS